MDKTELLQKNLDRWSLMCPEGVDIVAQTPHQYLTLCESDSGVPNLKRETNGTLIYLHSQEDPLAEADKWFASLPAKYIDIIYIYKIGLGYCYDAAKEWLKQNEKHTLVFFEDDAEVLRCLFETDRGSVILNDPQVIIYLIYNKNLPGINELSSTYALCSFIITTLNEQAAPRYPHFKAEVEFYANMNQGVLLEYTEHGLQILNNFFSNILKLPQAYLGNHLFGQFKNIPAIICGAGPSLDRNIHLLKSLSDRALIFAGGTAMNALNAKDVMPHFGIIIDPNSTLFSRLVRNNAFEVPFFYRNRTLPDALDMIHGDHLYVTGTMGYEIGKWLEESLGIKEKILEEGHNVLTFSTIIAHAMGCNPIICVGIDLAYTLGNSYASGIESHPIHSRKSHFQTRSPRENVISTKDIYGNPVETLWKWLAEAMWYTYFPKNNPGTILINSTEGGIGFPGIAHISLAEVCRMTLMNSYDLTTRLHGEIQNSQLPKEVSIEKIKELLNNLADSLKKCAGHYQTIVQLIIKKNITIQSEKKIDELDKQILEHQQKILKDLSADLASSLQQCADNSEQITSLLLNKEKAISEMESSIEASIEDLDKQIAEQHQMINEENGFKAILTSFNDILPKLFSREKQKLTLTAAFVDEKEAIAQSFLFEINQYAYLAKTAIYHAALIKRALNFFQTSSNENPQNLQALLQDQSRLFPFPSLANDEIYKYENQILTIIDPEMGIHYSEEFIPQDNNNSDLFYPSGNIKHRQFYKHGMLHGPSTYYREDGTILAITWYWNGQKEGKAWMYYASGSLHSLRRYRQGYEEGRQVYYYPNGLLKSQIDYVNHLLDGDVLLYHPNGQLERKLQYIQGKREGCEQMWDAQGMLRLEVHYLSNRPVKHARKWHRSGTLEKEVLYDDQSNLLSSKEWDENGKEIPREMTGNIDFYDQVNEKINTLTGSIEGIFTQLTHAMPDLKSATGDLNLENSLAANMQLLQQELDRMRDLEKRIQKEGATEDNSQKEASWKTPNMRMQMENQISNMNKEMGQALLELHTNYKRLLEQIGKEKFKPKK